MVLAKPVQDRLGRILLQEGEELTQPILDRLDAWGVIRVTVEESREPEDEEIVDPLTESQVLVAIDERLGQQFARYAEDGRMQALRDSARQALLKTSRGKGS